MLKNIYILILSILYSSMVIACHDVDITETDATDNGDGTYTYTFELCFGTDDGSETYGFYLDVEGGGNLLDWTPEVTGPTTGNVKEANVPTINGDGIIEYGDWQDTASPLLSDIDENDCVLVFLTFDEPINEATLGGVQPDFFGGCAITTTDVTSCFDQIEISGSITDESPCGNDGEIIAEAENGFDPYEYSWDNGDNGATIDELDAGEYTVTVTDDEGCTAEETFAIDQEEGDPNYTVELSTPDCIGDDVEWEIEDLDGDVIDQGALPQDGSSETFSACGCGAALNLTVPEGTSGNPSDRCDNDMDGDGEIRAYDMDGNLLGSATADGESFDLDCLELPVTLRSIEASFNSENNFNIIRWVTITEINNNYFEIQYAIDGKNWQTISTISGAGNSLSPKHYEQIHEEFISNQINYYKVIQVDYDGTKEELGILSVDNSKDKKRIKTVNLLGQEVTENYKGIVIHIYNDGTKVKEYW